MMGGLQRPRSWHSPTHRATLPKCPVLWWLHPLCCHPPNVHGMAATEEVRIGEGGRKGGKKQEEGSRKAVAELGVLFGPKGGSGAGMGLAWRGRAGWGCQASSWVGTRVRAQAEGWVGWPCPPAPWAPPHGPSCSLQLLQEGQEPAVPLVGLVQVAGVSGALQHQHPVLGEVPQVVQAGLPQLCVLVPVHDQRGGLQRGNAP